MPCAPALSACHGPSRSSARRRSGIAPVHERVHENPRQSIFARRPQQGVQVLLVRVHAAIGHQPEQMQLPSALARPSHRLHDRRHRVERICRNQRVNARDVHLHNAPRTNIQMAHFAVAHLPVRQTDKMFRCADQRVGKFTQQLVVSRFARQRNGVVRCFSTVTPSVEDGQYERTFRHGGFLECLVEKEKSNATFEG